MDENKINLWIDDSLNDSLSTENNNNSEDEYIPEEDASSEEEYAPSPKRQKLCKKR